MFKNSTLPKNVVKAIFEARMKKVSALKQTILSELF